MLQRGWRQIHRFSAIEKSLMDHMPLAPPTTTAGSSLISEASLCINMAICKGSVIEIPP